MAVNAQERAGLKISTVVIDPGHGGKDPGTMNGKIKEKDIVLSVGLMLGEMIKKNYPDVNVIYTRKTDVFIPLHQRAEIANKNHADLFISVHVNSVASKGPNGTETFVMGLDKSNSNFEVCQLENSVVVLEEDYSSRYQGFEPDNPESYIIFSLLQNSHLEQSLIFAEQVQRQLQSGPIKKSRGIKQNVFLVLWKCTMPAVLVELGFLSNPYDYRQLTDKNSQRRMAGSLYKAFSEYKRKYDGESGGNIVPVQTDRYRIQIMALSRQLDSHAPQFKGLKCDCVRSGKIYKYTYGRFATREEARKELQRISGLFPEAYIVAAEDYK